MKLQYLLTTLLIFNDINLKMYFVIMNWNVTIFYIIDVFII
jgi:hypothetical protein